MSTLLKKYIDEFENFGILFTDIEPYLKHLTRHRRHIVTFRWKYRLPLYHVAGIWETSTATIIKIENRVISRLKIVARSVINPKKIEYFEEIQSEAFNIYDMDTYAECDEIIRNLR